MRISKVAFLVLTLVAAGGCGAAPEGTEQAALGVSQSDLTLRRDLTLQQPAAPKVEVASPVELGLKPSERPRSRSSRRPHQPAAATTDVATTPATAPLPAAVSPEPRPVALAPSEPEPPDPHALPPGRSVTVIPASAGPVTDEGWNHEHSSGREDGVSVGAGPHGGGCKPRGGGRMPGGERPGAFR